MEGIQTPDLPQWLDAPVAFADHRGKHKSRLEKRQRKLLAKLPQLAHFLEKDERVHWLTTACSPTPIFEQLTTGWIVFYINRALLVVTDRRILHVPATQSYEYRDSIAEIRYTDCRDIRVKGRHLAVRFGNGKQELFLYMAGAERRRIKQFFRDMRFEANPGKSGRQHMCPRCTSLLKAGTWQCPGCRLAFKEMGDAMKMSIWLPGGGYFYTRHPFLGIGDFVVEAFLIFNVILFVTQAIESGDQAQWVTAGFFGFILVVEKLISIYHANRYIREYIPMEQPVKPQSARI